MGSKHSDAPHLSFLDGVRGLAALYVVLHHVWLAIYGRNTPAPVCSICLDAPWWTQWLRWGHLAVAIFIVVSGFSLALAPLRSNFQFPGGFGDYIQRRAVRIVPPYWIALLLSCLVVILFTGQFTGTVIDARAVFAHLFLVNNIIDSAKPNGVFWSIAVEWQIYFLFPLLLLACRWLSIRAMLFGTLALVLLVYALGTHHERIAELLGLTPGSFAVLTKLLYLRPQFLALFAFGVAAAYAHVVASHSSFPWPTLGRLLTLATLTLLWLVPTTTFERNFFWIDLLTGLAAAAAMAGFAQRRSALSRLLSSPMPGWLGQSSYSLYLIHAPILEIIVFGIVAPLSLDVDGLFLVALVLVVPMCVLAARGFWTVFELPFMRHRTLHGLRSAFLRWRASLIAEFVRFLGRLVGVTRRYRR
jgi:peptidoglycan/LPS O-acetylase OafA/YrhL